MSARPNLETFVVVEQVAHGRWQCVCPDGVPRDVTNYVEAMAGALFWASAAGFGVYCVNLDGVRDFALHTEVARLVAWRAGGAA